MGLKDKLQTIFGSYSQRRRSSGLQYKSDQISKETRSRILMLYANDVLQKDRMQARFHAHEFWRQIHQSLRYLLGRHNISGRNGVSESEDLDRFLDQCSAEGFFDFIELTFKQDSSRWAMRSTNEVVDAINEIFRFGNEPYQLTHMVELRFDQQIGLNAADKVLFIADGAPWIWRRIQRLTAALGLSPTQVLGLIDFYHAAKQLSDAVKLRRWSATQRTRWLNRTRGLLKRTRVDEVVTALRELCRGRTAGKIRTHLNYFLKNRHRFAYTTMVGLGLPRGSGAIESAIRRVINLRIKGASIYWLPESVDAILLLRSFYKSGRWNCLQRMAMTPVGVSA